MKVEGFATREPSKEHRCSAVSSSLCGSSLASQAARLAGLAGDSHSCSQLRDLPSLGPRSPAVARVAAPRDAGRPFVLKLFLGRISASRGAGGRASAPHGPGWAVCPICVRRPSRSSLGPAIRAGPRLNFGRGWPC